MNGVPCIAIVSASALIACAVPVEDSLDEPVGVVELGERGELKYVGIEHIDSGDDWSTPGCVEIFESDCKSPSRIGYLGDSCSTDHELWEETAPSSVCGPTTIKKYDCRELCMDEKATCVTVKTMCSFFDAVKSATCSCAVKEGDPKER